MVVPAAIVARDEGRTGFYQPPGQQRALAPTVAAVSFAQGRVFLAQVERLASPRAGDHLEGLLIEAIHRSGGAAGVRFAAELVETRQQQAAIVQPIDRQILREM